MLAYMPMHHEHNDLVARRSCVCCMIFAVRAYLACRDRFYLTNSALLGPRGSAWARVRDRGDDSAFIVCTGFDRACFAYLATEFEPYYQQEAHVRVMESTSGRGQVIRSVGRPRSLSAADVLSILLHWYRSRMAGWAMQLIFGVGHSVLSRALRVGAVALSKMLDRLQSAEIKWPDEIDCQRYSDAMEKYEPELPGGCIGFVDGTLIRIQRPPDALVENAYFSGSHKVHSINNIFLFAPNGCICWARINCPGSWHDSKVCEPLYQRLIKKLPPDGFYGPYYVLADSAFRATGQLASRVLKASTGGTTAMMIDPEDNEPANAKHESEAKAHQVPVMRLDVDRWMLMMQGA